MEPEPWWKICVGVAAVATYQAFEVAPGVDPRAGQRQAMVWARVDTCLPSRSSSWAQSCVPEVLAAMTPQELLDCAHVFSLSPAPPPPPRTLVHLELLDPDRLTLLEVEPLGAP